MGKDIQLLISDWCQQAIEIYRSNPDLHDLGVAEGLLEAVDDLLLWSILDEQEQ